MNDIGGIDINELESLKKTLKGIGYKITDDALDMIEKMEHALVTMALNYKDYCEHTAVHQKKLYDILLENSKCIQYTDEEIIRFGMDRW